MPHIVLLLDCRKVMGWPHSRAAQALTNCLACLQKTWAQSAEACTHCVPGSCSRQIPQSQTPCSNMYVLQVSTGGLKAGGNSYAPPKSRLQHNAQSPGSLQGTSWWCIPAEILCDAGRYHSAAAAPAAAPRLAGAEASPPVQHGQQSCLLRHLVPVRFPWQGCLLRHLAAVNPQQHGSPMTARRVAAACHLSQGLRRHG